MQTEFESDGLYKLKYISQNQKVNVNKREYMIAVFRGHFSERLIHRHVCVYGYSLFQMSEMMDMFCELLYCVVFPRSLICAMMVCISVCDATACDMFPGR